MKIKIILITFLFIGISSCQLTRSIVYNYADISDYKKFPKRDLHANSHPFVFPKGVPSTGLQPDKCLVKGKEVGFDAFLKANKTVAFLIIQNDSLLFEKYFYGYDSSSIVPSFSMAKAFTSALIGCAIEDGLIKSVDEHIVEYIPELSKNKFDSVTIKHLLQMTSGVDFKESYTDPFGEAAQFYYGTDLHKSTLHLTLKRTPGTQFEYTSGSTQLLGLVLERALKGETITHYLDRKIWFPLEMEFDGSWSIDKENGIEKTFCCINARARAFARFGRVYMHGGNWNGKQVIPENWVTESTTSEVKDGSVDYYKYQWWLTNLHGEKAFYAHGYRGQYIYVNPAKRLIMVRLGKDEGDANWLNVFTDYAQYLKP